MPAYKDVLENAQQLTAAEQAQLCQDLVSTFHPEQDTLPVSSSPTHDDPMLAFIGSIDEEPVTMGNLDDAIYG